MAKIFPSLSLNHAVLAPPAVAMLFTVLIPGMSYSSKTTPLDFSSATSASTSTTAQNAVLAFDVPAPADGYIKTQEPLPAFVDHTACVLLFGFQSDLFFVELAGSRHVGYWYVRNYRCVLQH